MVVHSKAFIHRTATSMKIAESLQKGIRFLLGLALNERYTITSLESSSTRTRHTKDNIVLELFIKESVGIRPRVF